MILGIIKCILGLYLMLIGIITESGNPIFLKFIPFLIGVFLLALGIDDLGIITKNI